MGPEPQFYAYFYFLRRGMAGHTPFMFWLAEIISIV